MDLCNITEIKALLARHGFHFSKAKGQNFLTQSWVPQNIVLEAGIDGTCGVLEVGPGIGTLTVAMLARVRAVCSIEADRELESVLAETCADHSEKFFLTMGDALRVGPQNLQADGVLPPPNKFVSNLPYQVAATLILRNFEEFPSLESATVMVQAEVADRICALPGSKIYGAYTAKLALWARPAGRFEVGPGNFMPPPHVDSAVVRLDRGGVPLPEGLGRAEVAAATDAAFAQRRKTIRNSMSSNGFDKEALDEAFAATGIAPNARAETLAPADFVRLAAALKQ